MDLTLFNEYKEYAQNNDLSIDKEDTLERIRQYYKTNSQSILNEIVKCTQKLIISLAYQWQIGTNLDVMEIIQEANLYLVNALVNHKFDDKAGIAFSTYIQTTMFNGVFKFIGKNSSQFSLTGYTPVKIADAKKINDIKYKENCSEADAIKIYKKKNPKSLIKSEKDLHNMTLKKINNIYDPVKNSDGEDSQTRLCDIIEDKSESIEKTVEKNLLFDEINKSLDNRSFNIFYDRFANELTMKELSKKYKLDIKDLDKIIKNSRKILLANKRIYSYAD